MTAKLIDQRLFLRLFVAFICATIVGTLSHEFGHYLVAQFLNVEATIHYKYTLSRPSNAFEYILITTGGPAQTLLTGTTGLILLFVNRNSFRPEIVLTIWQWLMIFISLFWLRPTANFALWIGSSLIPCGKPFHGDELKLANYYQWPEWALIFLTALIGVLVLATIILKFIPQKHRLTFLIAGLTGGITGYFLWLELFGKYILP